MLKIERLVVERNFAYLYKEGNLIFISEKDLNFYLSKNDAKKIIERALKKLMEMRK